MTVAPTLSPEEISAHWMPFTGNREFQQNPRIITSAEGCWYSDADGRKVFDGLSGLWTCGLGHGRKEIVEAVSRQIANLDYAPAFQFGHPASFKLAHRVCELLPGELNHLFFTGSGSESVETALKIARAYWRLKGQACKSKLIGRVKGYHGVNFGGISVGGIGANRALYGQTLDADHLPHTLLPENKFCKGMPATGRDLATHLEDMITLHDASNIAAVIVEPFSGSGGVIVPPQGYLQKLREICTKHDILLIFDEVITGFCRTGSMTGSEEFGVQPDIMTLAKQLTNGTQPMGAVAVKSDIYDTFMSAGGPDYQLEFPHGYTYSAHPVACMAGLATLDLLATDNAVGRVRMLAPVLEDLVHSLKGTQYVSDIRNYGLAAGLTIESFPGEPARRPYEIAMKCWEKGFYVRYGADTIQLAPPFVSEIEDIDALINALGESIRELD